MKLATTIAEMNAFTRSPADSVREYADTGFRYLDYSFYSVTKSADHPFMGDNWKQQILDAKAAAEKAVVDEFYANVREQAALLREIRDSVKK